MSFGARDENGEVIEKNLLLISFLSGCSFFSS